MTGTRIGVVIVALIIAFGRVLGSGSMQRSGTDQNLSGTNASFKRNRALLSGGTSGFNAVLAGNRSVDGQYERLEAHGFYWTASGNDPNSAPFYNFGKGSQALSRQPEGKKQMAVSVRCIRQ